MIIIDEIDDFLDSKRNQKAYKAYMSQKYSNFRLQWGKLDVIKQRISNFLGTFNGSEFIKDETGSSRFTIFSVKYFRNEHFLGRGNKEIELFDITRCWRKSFQLFNNGYNPEYTRNEKIANEEYNELFKHNTPEFESILKFVDKSNSKDPKAQFQTTTEICAELNRVQCSFIFKKNNIGKALARLGFERVNKRVNKSVKHGYFIKYKY